MTGNAMFATRKNHAARYGLILFQWRFRTGLQLAPSTSQASHSGFAEPRDGGRVQMPMKSGLSAAAFVTLVATSVMATASANAFPLPAPGSRFCDGAVSSKACTDHFQYVESLRSRARRGDTSPAY